MASTSANRTKTTTQTCSASADEPAHEAKEQAKSWAALAASCCLLIVGIGGGALLTWWAVSFHHSNERLWMVPVGLVLLGTPLLAWLSIFASVICRSFKLLISVMHHNSLIKYDLHFLLV
ncbi:unnamed protein product [Musa acuminata var. zebrina]